MVSIQVRFRQKICNAHLLIYFFLKTVILFGNGLTIENNLMLCTYQQFMVMSFNVKDYIAWLLPLNLRASNNKNDKYY